MSMESKAHQIFRQRIESSDNYLQTVYAAFEFTTKSLKENSNGIEIINEFLGEKFNALNHPVSEIDRIFNFSKCKICEYYIVELYKAVDEYLRNSIDEVFEKDPNRVLGFSTKPITLTGKNIIDLGNYKEICKKMTTEIYRNLEDLKSTKNLLEKYAKVFKIEIHQDIVIEALSVLELRHLIIHNNSTIDTDYEKKYSIMKLKIGEKIPTNFKFVISLAPKISKLINFFDNALLKNKLLFAIEKK